MVESADLKQIQKFDWPGKERGIVCLKSRRKVLTDLKNKHLKGLIEISK